MIRSARVDDLPVLGDIERAAGAAFRDLGMAAVADADPLSMGELTRFQADGRAWVVADEADLPVAYLLVEVVDGNGHVEQVSVHPDHARQGLGRTLLDAADRWALRRGLSALTLTTYADVPWNAPYYAARVRDRGRCRPVRGALSDPRARGGQWPGGLAPRRHAPSRGRPRLLSISGGERPAARIFRPGSDPIPS